MEESADICWFCPVSLSPGRARSAGLASLSSRYYLKKKKKTNKEKERKEPRAGSCRLLLNFKREDAFPPRSAPAPFVTM